MQISVLKVTLAPVIVVALNLVSVLGASADPGVFDDRIVFGQSAALKGEAAALGLGMRDGILAAFKEANSAGGVAGFTAASSIWPRIMMATNPIWQSPTRSASLAKTRCSR
jgi:hypothetical protein